MRGRSALCACRVIDESDVTGSAHGVRDEAEATSVTNHSAEPCRASAGARRVGSVRRHRRCVAVAVRGCRALCACRVIDVADAASVTSRSCEPRRAGTSTCGVGSVRRH